MEAAWVGGSGGERGVGHWGALVPPQGVQAGVCEMGLIPDES